MLYAYTQSNYWLTKYEDYKPDETNTQNFVIPFIYFIQMSKHKFFLLLDVTSNYTTVCRKQSWNIKVLILYNFTPKCLNFNN
jgi:hypothetical protein